MTAPQNHVIEGDQTVTITAHVAGWTDGSAPIVVRDTDRTLSISLPANIYENAGTAANVGTVTLGGTMTGPLAVSLSTSAPEWLRAVAPDGGDTLTVPSGQRTASFNLVAVDNALCDGTRSVTVTAAAATFPSAASSMAVLDDDVHHFSFENPPPPAEGGDQPVDAPFNVTIAAKDVNGVTIGNYSGVVGVTAAGDHGAVPITLGSRAESLRAEKLVKVEDHVAVPKALGVYHSYASLTNDLNAFVNTHPAICRMYSIGTSVQGREIWALKITDSPGLEEDEPEFYYASSLHGNERVGMEMSLYLVDYLLGNYGVDPRVTALVDSTEIWIVPLANPDGCEADTRENAAGVDLNRDYPEGGPPNQIGNIFAGPAMVTAGRAPETVALMQWNAAHRFVAAANFHTGALLVNYPYDNDGLGDVNSPTPDDALFRFMAETYSSANLPMWNSPTFTHGITNGAEWYTVIGGLQDWTYRYLGNNAVTIELSNTFQPAESLLPTYWQDNRESMLSFLGTVQMGVRGLVTDSTTGQPLSAQVLVQGNSHPVFTDPDVGDYHRMLLPGTYTLTISAPGYNSRTVTGVGVTAGAAARVDVGLVPLSSGIGFSNGVWAGTVAANALDTNVRLRASDGQGHTGESTRFNVVHGPMDHFIVGPVGASQAVNIPFPVTVTAVDAHGHRVDDFTGTADLSAGTPATASTVTIGTGTGTWNYPLHTNWHDARTQVIYRAAELGAASRITGLALDVATTPGQQLTAWTIRIKHTTLAAYAAPAWESTGWTTVYQSNTTVSATGWVNFQFTTPFQYNGTDNLLVDFSFNNSSYTSDGLVRATATGQARTIYAYTDSGYGDPLAWSGTTNPAPSSSTTVPNVRLTVGGVAPMSVADSSWGLPLDAAYHDARTQVIYRASEIGGPGLFTALALDLGSVPGQTLANWTVRMKHTTLSSFSAAAWDNAGWTLVYRASPTITATGWVNFQFTTSFQYNGVDNLMLDFSFNNSTASTSGYCHATETGQPRSLYYQTDSRWGNPLTWSGPGNLITPTPYVGTRVPNVRLLQGSAETTVTIGTGTATWYHPFHTYWHDARTQVIYTAAELGAAARISALALDVTTVPGQSLTNWTIRMKHTSLATYTTPAWEATGWTVVYQANTTVSATGWVNFQFTTPFQYNGTSNVLIDFSYNNSSYTSNGYVRTTDTGQMRSILDYTDSGYGDPLDWSGVTPYLETSTMVPNLRLTMGGSAVQIGTDTSKVTGNFVAGQWTGSVTVHQAATGICLSAARGTAAGESTTFPVSALPLLAVQTVVNGDTAQRSNVTAIAVQFNQPTKIQDLINSGAVLTLVEVYGMTTHPGKIDLSQGRHFAWEPATNRLLIDLTTDGFGGCERSLLPDDNYQLRLRTNSVRAAAVDAALQDMDSNPADGLYTIEFHRLCGDMTGNKCVDAADRAFWLDPAMVRMGARRGTTGYCEAADLDNDGVITTRDYYLWLRLVGASLS